MSRTRLCSTADVPEGHVRTVSCDGRSFALSNIDGSFYAIADVCTHDGGTLGEGSLRAGRVICPRHGAAFDARSGRALTLPAVRNVSAYAVTVEDGAVYIDLDDDLDAEPGGPDHAREERP